MLPSQVASAQTWARSDSWDVEEDLHGVEVVKGLVREGHRLESLCYEVRVPWTMMRDWALVTAPARFPWRCSRGDADADLARAGDGDEDAGEAFDVPCAWCFAWVPYGGGGVEG